MTATVSDFQERFPEFCHVTDSRVQMFLDDAALIMGDCPERWLSFYDVAQMYLAAHFLTMAESSEAGDSTPGGPIIRQEVDDVILEQATFHQLKITTDELYFTVYGKRFVRYRRMCFAGIYGV